jgi:steroid delta-isomerase-like uncharacterized protein
MSELNGSIEGILERYRQKRMSRKQLVAALAALGASSTAIATFLASGKAWATPPDRHVAHAAHQEHHNKVLHHEHVQRQAGAFHKTPPAQAGSPVGQVVDALPLSPEQVQRVEAILEDYADDAVVVDPLAPKPFIGKEAIRQRKLDELSAMSGVRLEVVNRFANHDQVIAEWVARGTAHGTFLGLQGNGRDFTIPGVTVVTRKNGKVIKESLYYDLDAVARQLA